MFKFLLSSKGLLIFMIFAIAGCDDDEVGNPFSYPYDDGPYLTVSEYNDSSICINWLTVDSTITELFYGEDLNPDIHLSDATKTRVHSICLENLTPDSTYYYTIPQLTALNNEVFQFRTFPDDATSFTFMILGDMQPKSSEMVANVELMANGIMNEEFLFWVQLGDTVQDGDVASDWHRTFTGIKPVAPYYPMAAVMGNHDFRTDDGFYWRTLLPFPFVQKDRAYYSFDYSNVRFIFIDNYETDWKITEEQLLWLEEKLLEARSENMWIFAFTHSTVFSSGCENTDFETQKLLIPLFDKYKVSAVFYGHDHMYEHYIYEYGYDGLFHDPAHVDGEHTPVHYFLSGGGGADLESEYSLTTKFPYAVEREWYNSVSGNWEKSQYVIGKWNKDKYVEWAPENSSPYSPNYYHIADEEPYMDEAVTAGQEYGENTMHYIKVQVDATECTISVHYPDSSLLEGPLKQHTQVWKLNLN
jgi:Calcineurin-like phosphoesterase